MVDTWNMAFQVISVKWDGTLIRRVDDGTFERTLDALQACGINELMLVGYTDAEEADFDMMQESARVGEMLRSRGMKGAQHHGLAPTYAADGKSQDAVIEKLIRSLQYTANLNADILLIHPCRADAHYTTMDAYVQKREQIEAEIGRDGLLETIAQNLNAAGEVAGKMGIELAIENADEPFESDMSRMEDIFEHITSPHVGFCLDAGHANYRCPPVTKWLDTFGDRLITTHFHDNRGFADEHMPPGFGTVPWIDVIHALKKVNYTNTITFESSGWPGMGLEEGYRNAIGFWRTCEHLAMQRKPKPDAQSLHR